MPDVFISYAHEDNDWPAYGSEGGWVQCFYKALNKRLNNLRRGTVVFLDESGGITGASALNDTIRQALTNCSVLVTIVSPTYLASDWCAKELQFFRDSVAKGGLTVATEKRGQLARVMKAIKIPVAHSDLKAIAAETDATGYPFWQDDGRGSPIELVAPHGDVDGTDFCRAINTIATDIAAVLQSLASGGNGKPATPQQVGASATSVSVKPSGPLIYLAETTSDMNDARERLRQELEQYGCTVVPATQQFPGPNYGEQVKGNLAGARLSIHPVGKSYGMVPEGFDESIVDLQYRLAVEHANEDATFARMVWMPPGVEPADDRQSRFITALQDDPALKVTSLEDFKTLVHDALTPPVEDQGPVPSDGGPRRGIYLIFNELDSATALVVNSYLTKRGFKVWTPTSDEKERLRLREHQKRLKLSQGVLIYYGLANDRWVQNMQMILAQDFVTVGKNTRARCVVLADPERDDKKHFTDPEFRIVTCFGGFEPERLDGFLRDMDAPPATA